MDASQTQELPAIDRPITSFQIAQARAFVALTTVSRLRLANWLTNPLCEPSITALVTTVCGSKLLRALNFPELALAVGIIRGGLSGDAYPLINAALNAAGVPCARITDARVESFKLAYRAANHLPRL